MKSNFLVAFLFFALMFLSLPASGTTPQFLTPSAMGPNGSARGMQVKLLSDNNGKKDYAVIFRPGDEPFAGLTQFAAEYHVESAHFTAIGGFHDAKLAWFDEQKKLFRINTVDQQTEVSSLVGDIALLNGKPAVHMHCALALDDGTSRGDHIEDAHVASLLEVFVPPTQHRCSKNTMPPAA